MIRVEGKVNRGEVRLYALSTCIWCRKTKRLLDENDIEYEYAYVDELDPDERNRTKEKVKELSGRVIFPTVTVDHTVITGFDESKLREAPEL